MALGAGTIWEVRTGGSDTVGSGGFDPGQTAGMFTDGAATSATGAAPVFTSASYNFVAGDAGAWVYIASGTNWTAGWYHIDSVGSNAATLNGASGAGVKRYSLRPTDVAGCATTASPTGATWSIDYSQQDASQITYTDLSSTGVGLTASSSAHAFGGQQVGNSIVVTGGTNFTTGRYVLASVAAGVGTFLGAANLHTDAGTNSDGAGRMGGAMASPALPGSVIVIGNVIRIKAGTYAVTDTTANVTAGKLQINVAQIDVEGYQTVRGDLGTTPLIQASGALASVNLVYGNATTVRVRNLTLDGANKTGMSGLGLGAGDSRAYWVRAINCATSGIGLVGGAVAVNCSTANCGTGLLGGGTWIDCEATTSTGSRAISDGAAVAAYIRCLAYGNTGGDGFISLTGGTAWINCVAYANGQHGFRTAAGAGLGGIAINCLSESNTNDGYVMDTDSPLSLIQCGAYNNGTNFVLTNNPALELGSFIGSGSFFTNAAGGDFSLNNTSGAGGAARARGIPGVFPSAATTGYLDAGVAQHADPAPGAGGGGGNPVSIFSA